MCFARRAGNASIDGTGATKGSWFRSTSRLLAIGTLAASLPSCALLKGEEPPRETYEIQAPTDVSRLGSTGAQILIKEPNALKAVDSDRIIVRPTANTITYLAGAQWSDTVPRMVQAKLVEAFENTRSLGATAKPGDGLVIDYQLIGDMRRFEIAGGRAEIEMSIKLLVDKTGQVLETRIFSASAGAGTADDAGNYVAAFDEAFDILARDMITWVLRRV